MLSRKLWTNFHGNFLIDGRGKFRDKFFKIYGFYMKIPVYILMV